MLRQLVDARGQQGDLHVRRARVFRVQLKLFGDFRLFRYGNRFQVYYAFLI